MSFNNVRYPKSALLCKYVSLDDDGTFKQSTAQSKKLMYGGMLNLRSLIIFGSHQLIGQMGTIAARYSFKRRQFTGRDGPDYPEAFVMQYQMQQHKVVPAIAYSWAMLYTLNQIQSMYNEYN